MAGRLFGLKDLGLEHLENEDIFEKPKPKVVETKILPREEDFIYDKKMICPVCGQTFSTKVMKTGRNRLLSSDRDLRPVYDYVDPVKYDVYQCTFCGYASLSRFYDQVTQAQRKAVKEKISTKVVLHPFLQPVYSYEDAIERYKLALANAVVKKAKSSEKAYICLKSAWLFRGYAKILSDGQQTEGYEEATRIEREYLQNAYQGFLEARASELYPICGMDENTMDYLIAALAFELDELEMSSKMVSKILTSKVAGKRTKDRARDLKDEILEYIRHNK